MIDAKTIMALSNYARIGVSREEAKTLLRELTAVLDYVAILKEVRADAAEDKPDNRLREDEMPHASSLFRESLLEQAPATRDGFVATKHVFDGETKRHDDAE